jgi:rubrerythrin
MELLPMNDMASVNRPNELRCFTLAIKPNAGQPGWLSVWRREFANTKVALTDRQEESMARLLPLLLCGEQSAILIFGSEVERLQGASWRESIALLSAIETDEYGHEQALQELSSMLMVPADLHQIKRRAQLFYLSIGKAAGLDNHFANISQLDACVALLMHAVANSGLGRGHCIAHLFDRIKQDEARHVVISRQHFLKLGGDKDIFTQSRNTISHALVSLLSSEASSFENLGIDPDQLFATLTKGNY